MLPRQSGLRQWVLTLPFPWRRRLAQDGAPDAKTGAVTVVHWTSSDLRLNPHLHVVALDSAWYEQGGELCWQGLGHLQTSEVGTVLESTVRRIERYLRRRDRLGIDEDSTDPDVAGDPETNLAASAVSGRTPPAGPQWVSSLQPPERHPFGLVRITLKKASADGTVAVDMDPSREGPATQSRARRGR